MNNSHSLQLLQKRELHVLQAFHDFCEAHQLTYFLTSGTLLGAIRHQGFIPWDDDVDVLMPRQDYENFIALFLQQQEKQLPLKLATPEHTLNYYVPCVKLFDSRFPMQEPNLRKACQLGPWIDIFPLDNMSNDYKKAVKLFNHIKQWRRVCEYKRLQKSFTYKKLKSILQYVYFKAVAVFPLSFVLRHINQLSKKYAADTLTTYVCVVVMGSYGLKEIMPRVWFENRELHVFEGKEFYIPNGWHEILTRFYGDYMTPRKHDYVHFDL